MNESATLSLPKSWEIKTLGQVCRKITDGSHNPPKGTDYSDFIMLSSKNVENDHIHYDKPRYLNKTDFLQENKRTDVEYTDVLLTIVGTIGRVAVVPKEHKKFTLQRSVAVLKVEKEEISSRFLMFSLQNIFDFLANEARGVAQKGIYLKQLRLIQIPIPPLSEQKQIVALLDQAFAAIDQAKANIEKNIQNAKELFQSKLNGIFSHPSTSSEQDGDGWEEKSLGDETLLKIIDGDRGKNYPKKSDFLEEGHCVFMNTGNVRPDGFDFSNVVFITNERDNLLRKGKLQREDVVMTTRGTIGNLGWYNSDVEYNHIRLNSGMLIFRVNQEKILPEYLFTLFRSSIVKQQIIEKTSGAAQPQLPIKTLVTFKIPVSSSLTEQKKMVSLIKKMETQQKKLVDSYSNKISNLIELKKSILQKAFAGELTSTSSVSNPNKVAI